MADLKGAMKMTRIDRIRTMTVSEIADAILDNEYIADEDMGFCKSICNLDDYAGGELKEECRESVIKWLMEEV